MNNKELLKEIGEILSRNVGSNLTNELASGIYGTIQQALERLNPEKTEEDK